MRKVVFFKESNRKPPMRRGSRSCRCLRILFGARTGSQWRWSLHGLASGELPYSLLFACWRSSGEGRECRRPKGDRAFAQGGCRCKGYTDHCITAASFKICQASTDAELLTLCAIGTGLRRFQRGVMFQSCPIRHRTPCRSGGRARVKGIRYLPIPGLFGAQDVDLSSKLLSDATIARFCQVRSVADPFIFVLVVTRRFTDCQDVLLADQNLRTLRRRQSRCSMLCSASPCNLCQAQLERLARCQTFASCADQAEGLEFNRW